MTAGNDKLEEQSSEWFQKFLSFFDQVQAPGDLCRLAAAVITPLTYEGPGMAGLRPLIVFVGPSNSGKTAAVKSIVQLYGGPQVMCPHTFSADSCRLHLAEYVDAGCEPCIAHFDNLGAHGLPDAANLEEMLTCRRLAGDIENRCTWFATMRDSTRLPADLVERCFFVRLNIPEEPEIFWWGGMSKFLASHGRQVLASIEGQMRSTPLTPDTFNERWASWCEHTLHAACGCWSVRQSIIRLFPGGGLPDLREVVEQNRALREEYSASH